MIIGKIMTHYIDLPNEDNSYYDDSLRYELHPDIVFVFGSNLAGRHGAGAAKHALQNYGAIYGKGIGLQGRSYGIPTKDEHMRVLHIARIANYIKDFVKWSKTDTGLSYYITPVGTGLAGFNHSRIAPLFKGIKNAWLPYSWKPYLQEHKHERKRIHVHMPS